MGVFEKLMKKMAEYHAREFGGIGWEVKGDGFETLRGSIGKPENG